MSLPRILPKCSPEEFLRRKAGRLFLADDLRNALGPEHLPLTQSLIMAWSKQGRIRYADRIKSSEGNKTVWRVIG